MWSARCSETGTAGAGGGSGKPTGGNTGRAPRADLTPDRITLMGRIALRAFMDFSIPQDLCDGSGYPQLTDQAKRKILGENLLRLHGMDVAETPARLGRPPA